MSEPGSLVNIGEWSRPITVLVKRISDAIGGIALPWQIIRIAKAEAKAELIRAESRIEITGLQHRALMRFLAEEENKQRNMESIIQKAILNVQEDAKPEQIEEDWLVNFFDRCRLISGQEMQLLWSRLLAGEANAPGRFSKRTMNLLATLESTDALLLQQLRTFCLKMGGKCIERPTAPTGLVPLILEDRGRVMYEKYIKDLNISLVHMADLGLIYYDASTFTIAQIPKEVHYFDTFLRISARARSRPFSVGYVVLTGPGYELASICESNPSEEFLEYILEQWPRYLYGTVKVNDQEKPT